MALCGLCLRSVTLLRCRPDASSYKNGQWDEKGCEAVVAAETTLRPVREACIAVGGADGHELGSV